jgi:hypothetical protein
MKNKDLQKIWTYFVSCDVVCGPKSLSGHSRAARKEVVLSYKSPTTEEKKGRGIRAVR